ncbi:MAG: MerR family transcriptional regulator [Bacteroidetes bacterium]|nr:MerR family transcriptional regulator [Bacteroidota bacterium]
MDTVDIFSITDVQRLTGIKAHTLRAWEKRYGLPEPQRTSTNIRYYSNDEVRALMTIRMLNGNGLRISTIAAMSVEERRNYLNDAMKGSDTLRHAEDMLLLCMMEADEGRFSQVYSKETGRLGLEQAFVQIFLPFFERIGILWQTGAIEPAQEHYFFNLIRQKLIAGTEFLGVKPSGTSPAVLLFLPEHELHELGLLFYNYAFRARGCRTFYLGQSVPLNGLERMLRLIQPQYIVTGMTNPINPLNFQEYYARLRELAGGAELFFTGPEPVKLKRDYDELKTTDDLIRCLLEMPVASTDPGSVKPGPDRSH